MNVSNKYDNGNDDWLSTDDNAWPVAYHGLSIPDFAIPKLIATEVNKVYGMLNLKSKVKLFII